MKLNQSVRVRVLLNPLYHTQRHARQSYCSFVKEQPPSTTEGTNPS